MRWMVGLVVMLVWPAVASAAPDITLSKSTPGQVLYGTAATVTLTASNPAGQPPGYNLSVRDVLPPGVQYATGSASVAPEVIADAPTAGSTTLIWSNLVDVAPGSSRSFSYSVTHDTATYAVGDTYTNQAAAYVNTDPHVVPTFGVTGEPDPLSFTGTASASATTQLVAVEVTKDEPSLEGELLRGLHDHQTVYTITLRNNDVNPTSGLALDDYLPAGLEYLACGGEDNTTDAPTNPGSPLEYPAAPPLGVGSPAAPDCERPTLVQTVDTDPDGAGPLPAGVYTHVRWLGLGTLGPGEERRVQYVAGIPLRANTMTFTGPVPLPVLGGQAANLDNNNGPETTDEQALTNLAVASGDYGGTPVTSSDDLTRTAEDLAIHKTVDRDVIAQGDISTWSLRVRSSEYRRFGGVTITDTLPDGLCPLGDSNFENPLQRSAECDPVPGTAPSNPYTDVTEHVDGTYTIAWAGLSIPENSDFTYTFPTRARGHYQQNFVDDAPVEARDTWTNRVSLAGAGSTVPGVPSTIPDGTAADDVSEEGQQGASIAVDKRIAQPGAAPVDCDTATYVDGPVATYHPGDRICYRVRVTFPGTLNTSRPDIIDFLPAGVVYEPGSMTLTAANTIPAAQITFDAANPAALVWSLRDADGGAAPDQVFEAQFSAIVTPPTERVPGDVLDNLLKVAFYDSAGQIYNERDEADAVYDEAVLDLVKGVRDVNGSTANPPDTDGVVLQGGDLVTYRIDVTNRGGVDALDAEVWDPLPNDVDCSQIDAISDGGTCADDVVRWTGVSVAAGATTTLTFRFTTPPAPRAGLRVDNFAGVRTYATATNTGGAYTYVPENNIDPAAPPANAPAADDGSWVVIISALGEKTRSTELVEAGNTAADQATIGEEIAYTLDVRIPEGTRFFSARLTDPLGARQTLLPATVTATLNGAPLPVLFILDTSNNTVTVTFDPLYTNPIGTGEDVLLVSFRARVDDVAANVHGSTLPNTASLSWSDIPFGTPDHTVSASVDTTIVEPSLTLAKTDDDADGRVAPGQTVRYTVTAGNSGSTAHDLVISDTVPEGLTPVNGLLPVPDGGIAGPDGGVWDATARTLTWTFDELAPGASEPRRYDARVATPAAASAIFTNTATLTGTSLPDPLDDDGERSYSTTAQDSVRLEETTIAKTVNPTSATIGNRLTYTVDLTLQPNVTYFDTTILDTLPAGVVYDATTSITCVSGCPPDVTGTTLPPAGQSLGWYLADIPAAPDERVVRVLYTAHVDDTVQRPDTLTNATRGVYNTTDKIAGTPPAIPDPAPFDGGTNTASATVTVIEPHLTLDKDVSGDPDDDDARETQPGDTYTYALTIANDGDSPAYDITVTDEPDTELTAVVLTDGAALAVDDWTPADPDIRWVIPGPLAPGASITLRYTAALAASGTLSDGQTVVNTADVPSYFGVPEATRTADGFDYREYDDVPEDTVTLTVDLPTLAVAKTPDAGTAEIGRPFRWTVTVTNTATTAVARDVQVVDELPAEWSYVAGSATPSEPAVAGRTLTWTGLGDLAPGASVTVAFDAVPAEAAGRGPQTNTAAATATDAAGAAASADGPYRDEDTGQANLVAPTLEIEKTPDGATADAGDAAAWTVRVSNTGDGTARNVRVVDTLPAGVTYVPGTATAAPPAGFTEVSVAGATITWNIAQLDAGAAVVITLPVTLDPALLNGTTLVNTAQATADEVSTPVSDTGSFVVANDVDVAIDKSADKVRVIAGETLTYTLVVTNAGPSVARLVTVSDPLPAGTTFISASAPCTLVAATVLCPLGALAPGDRRELTVVVRVDSGATGSVDNAATVGTVSHDRDVSNNRDDVSTPIDTAANLTVVKRAERSPVLQGETVEYVMTVRNLGPSDAVGVRLRDELPPGTDLVAADPGCVLVVRIVECAIGVMPALSTVERRVTLRLDDVAAHVNVATVDAVTPETNLGDNEADAVVVVLPTANLSIVKTGDATVEAGGVIGYSMVVHNDGPSPATGVTVTDTLPDGTEFVSATGCTASAQTLTCVIGDLAVGADSAPIEVRVRAPLALADQTVTNRASVSGDQGDRNPLDNHDHADTLVGPAVDLEIVKTTAGAVAGGTISWTLAITNRGPSVATGVVVDDTLPAGVAFLSATPAQGTCALTGTTVHCELGTLAVGASTQIVVTASVPASLAGTTLTNTATVSGVEPEIDPPDNTDSAAADVRVVVPLRPPLEITKTASVTSPRIGEPFEFTVNVHKPAPGEATGVVLTEPLPAGLDLVSTRPSQGTCSGRRVITCRLGTIPAGATATVVFRVVATRAGTMVNTASADSVEDPAVSASATVRARVTRTTLRLTKRARRHVVPAGRQVTFDITLRAPTRALQDAVLCDSLPRGLVLVRAPGSRLRSGRPCWTWAYIAPGESRRVRLVTRVAPGVTVSRLTNRATARADNAGRRAASDTVRVPRLGTHAGGVTG